MATAIEKTVSSVSPRAMHYAREHGLEAMVRPLLKLTEELFPNARRVNVDVQQDMDVPGLGWVAYEVILSDDDEPEKGAAWDSWVTTLAEKQQEWSSRLLDLCPVELVPHFVIRLGFAD